MTPSREQVEENRRAVRERALLHELERRLARGLPEQDRLTYEAHGKWCGCTRCERHRDRMEAPSASH